MPLRDHNPPHASGARAVILGGGEVETPEVSCQACGSENVGVAWTHDGEPKRIICRCGWRWASEA